MVIPTGTRLGVYDVTALMGEGAMDRWSAACDTKLNRDVGLRVLSDSFASDPDRLARVTREAKTFASLNHPNVTQRLQPDAQRTMIWKSLLLPALLACAVTSVSAQAELPVEVRAAMDKAATEVLQTTGAPSASSAAVRDGKVACVNAYGRASLDPPVNATPEMRYSIG